MSGGDSFQDRKGVLGAPPESVNAPCASQPAPDPKLTPAVPLNPFELSTAQLRKVAEALEQRMEGASRPPRDSGRLHLCAFAYLCCHGGVLWQLCAQRVSLCALLDFVAECSA